MEDHAYHAWLLDLFRDAEETGDAAREDARRNVDYYDGAQYTDEELKEFRRRGQPALVFNVIRPKIDYLQGMERTQRTKPRALPRTPADEDQAHAATDALRFVADQNDYDDKRSRVWGDILKVGWGGHEITVEAKTQRNYPVGASAAPMSASGMVGGAGGSPDMGGSGGMLDGASGALGLSAGVPQDIPMGSGGYGGVSPSSALMGTSSLTRPPPPAYDVRIRRCSWDRMVWDPYSTEDDFSDASYLGLVVWMDRDQAVRKYGEGAAQVFDETVQFDNTTFSDKPQDAWVRHGTRKRVRIVQLYHINPDDGEWDFCEFTKGGILQSGPSPWTDENGAREHPYAWRSAYTDQDNDRYGPIRDMRPVQDEVNKRRSKALHQVTVRQTFGRAGALGDKSVKDLRRELARPDGHVELAMGVKWGEDFGLIETADMAAGQMKLLEQAHSFFETLGPNAAMQGTQSGAPSGRALLASQQGGTIQLGTLTDALRQMDFDCYRKVWLRIKQFWTAETWIRVTDDPKSMRWVGLNEPAVEKDEQGNPILHPMTGQPIPVIDPATGQQRINNDVSALNTDIIIDEAPTAGSLADEQGAQMIQLKQMDQGNLIPFSDVVNSMPNLRDKGEIVARIRQREDAAAQPNPVAIAGAQAEVAGKVADAKLKEAQAVKTMADAGRAQAETTNTEANTRKTVVDTHGSAVGSVLDAAQAAQAMQEPLMATPPNYTVPAP